ncbi:hypothetical protein [uncultured Shewanella sp.]|uniref:hypothetical protein n=1 Tax=uncultured Shewanella sp. TaxID=173975 RepID=UPI002614DD06|nr:hypothetical protein [uncultured Shewanella sp.]
MPGLDNIQTQSIIPTTKMNIEDNTEQLFSTLFGTAFISSSSFLTPESTADIVQLYSGPEDIPDSTMDNLQLQSISPFNMEDSLDTIPIFQLKQPPKKIEPASIYTPPPTNIPITTHSQSIITPPQTTKVTSIIQSGSPAPLAIAPKKVFETTSIGNINIANDPINDPKLHSHDHVASAQPDDYVNVMRIISPTQPKSMSTDVISGLHVSFSKMYNHSVDAQASAPSRENVQGYVNQNRDVAGDLIEFTTNPTKVRKFASEGTRHFDVLVSIQKKFLTESESSEEGWMAKQNAPYTIVSMHGYDTSSSTPSLAKRMTAQEAEKACNAEKEALLIFEEQQIGKAGFAVKYGKKALLENAIVREHYKGDKANPRLLELLAQQISKL